MEYTTTSTARLNDDAKVDKQNHIDNFNWLRFSTPLLYQTNPTASVTQSFSGERYGLFDVTTTVNEITIYVELKERWEHFATYMIDTAKIDGLRELVATERSTTNSKAKALLVVMEPANDSIYTFDLDRVKWSNTPVRNMWVRKSTLRDEEGATDTMVEKPFYFLDWSDSKKHGFSDWCEATKATISQKAVNNC